MTKQELLEKRTEAYVAFTSTGWHAAEMRRLHGERSTQYIEARERVTPLREAFGRAADEYRAAPDEA